MKVETNPYTETSEALRKFFGHFPQVERFTHYLLTIKDYRCDSEEPDCLAIIGDTGTGKSTLLTTFARRFPRIEHPDHTEVPILYLEVPAKCTIKRLSGFMLQTLGSTLWNRGDEEDRTHQLVTLLKGCAVRMIILDEVNHLADVGAAKTHYQVGDWIKQLSRKAAIPVVLAGTPSAAILWNTNEQLADRYEVATLSPLSMEPDRVNEFRRVMKVFQGLMGRLKVVDLTEEKMLSCIAFATAGRLRDIRKLLVRAVKIAQAHDSLTITRQTLADAFAQVIFSGAPPKRNPFDPRFDGLPLTKPGEPFFTRGYRK